MTAEIVADGAHPRATYDLYHGVHKGLRHAHGRMLARIGTCDPRDRDAVMALAEAVEAHIAMSRSHLEHENAAIHTALEERVPGASLDAAHEHDEHEHSFEEIAALLQALRAADDAALLAALNALYRRFTLFIAHDFLHMDGEEHVLQPILQENFSDGELQAIEGRILAAIPPDEMIAFMRHMLPAASLPEREEMLAGMRGAMPSDAFVSLMSTIVGTPWSDGDLAAFDRI